MLPKKISYNRVIAINQFKGVVVQLSRQGLIDLLVKSYKIEAYGDPNALRLTRDDLIEQVLICEYGADDVQAFNDYKE